MYSEGVMVMTTTPGQITQLLQELKKGRTGAADELIPLVYDELRRIASRYMRRERMGHTLQPTALVHEAYMRVIARRPVDWQGRSHFFAVAAQVMRHLLVDYARERQRAKRGGVQQRVSLDEAMLFSDVQCDEFVALDEALARLAELDPRQSQIVELRYFGGLTVEETAETLDISAKTVKRDWSVARAWLHRELTTHRQ